MSRFLDALRSGRALLMDGAMGSQLRRRGLRDEENAATWNLLRPEHVRAVHQAYRDAGAEVLLTNTLLINAASYQKPWEDDGQTAGLLESWRAAFDLIGPGDVYRLAAVGPVAGELSRREFEDLRRFHTPSTLPFDGVLIETCSSPRARFAVRRACNESDSPVLLSLAYLRNEAGELVTYSGHRPEWFAERVRSWGLAALGVNCGRDVGMGDVIEIVRRYRRVTDVPLFARPNAGTPRRAGQRHWIYPYTPEQMAERLPELLEAGVSMVGGCCGTTPAHIAAFRRVVDEWNARLVVRQGRARNAAE